MGPSVADLSPHRPHERRAAVDERGSGTRVAKLLLVLLLVLAASVGLIVTLADDRADNTLPRDSQDRQRISEADVTDAEGDIDTVHSSGEDKNKRNESQRNRTADAGSTARILNDSLIERQVLRQVNEEREAHGLRGLREYDSLSGVSRNHSRNMSETGYVRHVTPSGGNISRYSETCESLAGFGKFTYSENIAQTWHGKKVVSPDRNGTVSPRTEEEVGRNVVNIWMNSSSHRKALLGDDWRSTGVGVVSNESGAVFATQSFCTRGRLP